MLINGSRRQLTNADDVESMPTKTADCIRDHGALQEHTSGSRNQHFLQAGLLGQGSLCDIEDVSKPLRELESTHACRDKPLPADCHRDASRAWSSPSSDDASEVALVSLCVTEASYSLFTPLPEPQTDARDLSFFFFQTAQLLACPRPASTKPVNATERRVSLAMHIASQWPRIR